jgi:FkbM family methyltransferase
MKWPRLFQPLNAGKNNKETSTKSPAQASSSACLNNVVLFLDDPAISDNLRSRILQGKYEKQEAKCIMEAGEQGDRLLEVGAGIGYISFIAGISGKFTSITCVEANPELIPLIRRNHEINKVTSDVINGAAVADKRAQGAQAAFFIRNDFWASSMSPRPPGYSRQVEIPQICIQDLIDRIQPSFFVCDIEGGEAALIPRLNFAGVSKVMIELHQRVIGRQGMKQVFDAMSSQGFHYDQWHSSGGVVLFSNITR